jgi:L-threonylcarbamoyladenylate synthase
MLEAYGGVEVVYATTVENNSSPAPSPGMKYRHYAPNVPVKLFSTLEQVPVFDSITVIGLDDIGKQLPENVVFISLGMDKRSAAARIYMALREAERYGRVTYVQLMDEEGIGIAYNERVTRAAGTTRKLAD